MLLVSCFAMGYLLYSHSVKLSTSNGAPGQGHVGLAAWDKFMAYRNIQSSAAPEYEPKCMVSSRCTPVRPLTESMHTYPTPRDHSYIRFPPAGRSDSTYLHRDYCPQRLTCGAFL